MFGCPFFSVFIFLSLAAFLVPISSTPDCARFERLLTSNRINSTITNWKKGDDPQSACSVNGKSCCTPLMENHLIEDHLEELDQKAEEHNAELRSAFTKMHKKFDDYFLHLIDSASTSLDQLFYQAYGDLYANNSQLFVDLFPDLKAYYRGSSLDVQERFEIFFTGVLQRVFKLLNPKRLISENYLQCIADNMFIIQPFALMPETISAQVQRSFANARTFARSLKVASKLEGGIINQHKNCATALGKAFVCPQCQGHLTTKPCYGLCFNVLSGCLVDHLHLQQGWKAYIDALRSMVYRLEGPYNIEAVLDPIDVKISEAIMMLQDNKADITAAIFKFCGTPPFKPNVTSQPAIGGLNFPVDLIRFDDLPHSDYKKPRLRHIPSDDITSPDAGRQKRSTRKKSHSARKRKRNPSKRREKHSSGKRIKNKTKVNSINDRFSMESPQREPRINQHLSEVKQVIDDYENHWMALSHQLCRNEVENSDTCWNGNAVGKYRHHVVGDGIKHHRNNPEVNVNSNVLSSTTRQQLLNLRRATESLMGNKMGEDAYRGLDDVDGMDYSGGDSIEGSTEKDEARLPFDVVTVTTIPSPTLAVAKPITTKTTTNNTSIKILTNTSPTTKCDGCGGSTVAKSSILTLLMTTLITASVYLGTL